MSDREQDLMKRIEALPPELRQRFADQIEGAAKAVEELRKTPEERSA